MKACSILLSVIFASGLGFSASAQKSGLTGEQIAGHLENRNNPLTWDKTMFKQDMKFYSESPDTMRPMRTGVFPVPDYNLLGEGSFSGNGNWCKAGDEDDMIKIGGRTIVYNSFFILRNGINRDILGDKPDEVFFQIIVSTDSVDLKSYSHMDSGITSRNHPDIVGKGFIHTRSNSVEYIAFLTGDRSGYAIVNMRLFDLNRGRTILIAPQEDGSLRSMQLHMPLLSYSELDEYTGNLMKRKDIIDFFTIAQ